MRTPNNERLTPDIAEVSAARNASEPERRCVLTGETAPRAGLVRLALSPDGLVLPDVQAKAPGRGAWIGVDRATLNAALADGRLERALKRAFKDGRLDIPTDLDIRIQHALERQLLDRLGLELRIGTLILGTERIAETARAGGVALLLHASDASESGRKRLDQAWRVGEGREGSRETGIILPLDRNGLSVALGRDNVVHLALAEDRAAERVGSLLVRLLHFLGEPSPAILTDRGHGAPVDDDELNT
ncbi:DUF448 domain-containing protein [Porphyrobacter algicida]|uniref:DUF448 domain-containing protein n=1 Tax=Qipengyuania algicida TaxID=1836209 RepID=A0A845ALG4_9SPHN|nr:DUF448 domain-containing protein [Qipengyuania algicida]MXP30003.1 DUF448 domain-containing protein [Qipengyuania algicida]